MNLRGGSVSPSENHALPLLRRTIDIYTMVIFLFPFHCRIRNSSRSRSIEAGAKKQEHVDEKGKLYYIRHRV